MTSVKMSHIKNSQKKVSTMAKTFHSFTAWIESTYRGWANSAHTPGLLRDYQQMENNSIAQITAGVHLTR